MRNVVGSEVVRNGRFVALGVVLGVMGTMLLGNGSSVDARQDGPATLERIEKAVEALPPACRMIARRGIKQTLDHGRRAWISERDLTTVTAPLARGGTATCDSIAEQRFGLGEV